MAVELLLGEDVPAVLWQAFTVSFWWSGLCYCVVLQAQGPGGSNGADRQQRAWDVNITWHGLTSQLKDTMVMAVRVATLAGSQWIDEGESVREEGLQECIAMLSIVRRGDFGRRGFILFGDPAVILVLWRYHDQDQHQDHD